ncbi:DUF1206 domain-containing protein [Pseudalkalibacillus berkeleyi]|uniref:DUF1206 domain-containing protein n=1 Tax=Pseudalkalibacillus berkeleyi TaxID=1069813 RepID=A0ABS9GV58_9BACL|nr:DUF1206 domain-containing protein [Pseudalkalibacillus berkeleyi]MCF6136569.1 DUF1206 domain-containing protein [Pseudalkalibacillus berkeleyi]
MMDIITDKLKNSKRAKEAQNDVTPWIRWAARFGYFSKGSVYILIGILSMMAAAGIGGKTTDSSGAFASVASKPFGEVLLWIVAIGLIAYVGWRLIQTFWDPENKGFSPKGLVIRIGYLISGAIYGGLAFKAFQIASHAQSSGSSKQTYTAKLMSQPYGTWVVGIVGIIIIVFGLKQMFNGYKEKFAKKFKMSEMSSHEFAVGKKIGKLGLIARGITFAIIGYFLTQTAITSDSDKVIGLDGALAKIAQQPFGQFMLGAVAIGLFLYGVFQLLKGKNRHMGGL